MKNIKLNKYVGSRYIPKFDGEWDKSKDYEPLTIVVCEGNSYTSRTYVPVGVDINNAKFWFCSGNYNAQIEQYRRDVLNTKTELFEAIEQKFENSALCENSLILYVAKRGGQFKTVNSAIEYASKYANIDNKVTIFIASGVYEEEITLLGNCGIDLIGVSPTSTIIRYSSKYPNSPLFTTGRGSFTNIGFQAVGGDSYALHIESQVDGTQGEVNFNNCHFISYVSNAIGIGLGDGVNVIFNNCAFNSTKNGSNAVYIHNHPSIKGVANARFINCQMYGDFQVDDASAIYKNNVESILLLSCVNNWFCYGKLNFRVDSENNIGYIPYDNERIKIVNTSYGNNIQALNYKESDALLLWSLPIPEIVPNTDYRKLCIPLECANERNIIIESATIDGVINCNASDFKIQEKYLNSVILEYRNSENVSGKSLTICYRVR